MDKSRRDEIEAWWALISRVLAFLLGGLILGYETIFEQSDRPILLLVAAGLMGPMVAAGVAQVLAAWKGAHNE
jgi:hypothetical protein